VEDEVNRHGCRSVTQPTLTSTYAGDSGATAYGTRGPRRVTVTQDEPDVTPNAIRRCLLAKDAGQGGVLGRAATFEDN